MAVLPSITDVSRMARQFDALEALMRSGRVPAAGLNSARATIEGANAGLGGAVKVLREVASSHADDGVASLASAAIDELQLSRRVARDAHALLGTHPSRADRLAGVVGTAPDLPTFTSRLPLRQTRYDMSALGDPMREAADHARRGHELIGRIPTSALDDAAATIHSRTSSASHAIAPAPAGDEWVAREPGRLQDRLRALLHRAVPDLVHVEGAAHIPEGPVLFVPMHGSNLDAAYLIAAIPEGRTVRAIANRDLIEAPVLGSVAKRLGAFPVTLKGSGTAAAAGEGAAKALEREVAMLQNGQSVAHFGEGRMVYMEGVGEGRSGIGQVAIAAGVPVVPIGSTGPKPSWTRATLDPESGTWVRERPWPFGRRRTTVVFGEPLRFTDLEPTRTNIAGATEAIWQGVDRAHRRAASSRREALLRHTSIAAAIGGAGIIGAETLRSYGRQNARPRYDV